MTKYEAIFKNGRLVFTSEQFNSRLEVYNYICRNRLGLKFGNLIEIKCAAWIR